MLASERESKYPETTGFIYSECAKRLKKRKLALNLTDAEIAGDYDRKIVNRILNNTRTRNNPHPKLICFSNSFGVGIEAAAL